MKISVRGGTLAKALQYVMTAIRIKEGNSSLLKNAYLETGEGSVKIAMTNLEMSAQFSISCSVEEVGVLLVNPDKLLAFAKNSASEIMEISQSGTKQTQVLRGQSHLNLSVDNIELFPKLPQSTSGDLKLPIEVFSSMLDRTVYVLAETDRMGSLTEALHLEKDGDKLIAVATDLKRVVAVTQDYASPFETMEMPKSICKAILLLMKNVKEDEGVKEVAISYSDNNINFTFGELFISARKLIGNFPNWKGMRPKSLDDYAKINLLPVTLKTLISDVVIIKGEAVLLEVSPGRIKVAEQSQEGSIEAFIDCTTEGILPAKSAMNSKQILEFLSSLIRGTVASAIELDMYVPKDTSKAVLFHYKTEDSFIEYAAMPVAVEGFNSVSGV